MLTSTIGLMLGVTSLTSVADSPVKNPWIPTIPNMFPSDGLLSLIPSPWWADVQDEGQNIEGSKEKSNAAGDDDFEACDDRAYLSRPPNATCWPSEGFPG